MDSDCGLVLGVLIAILINSKDVKIPYEAPFFSLNWMTLMNNKRDMDILKALFPTLLWICNIVAYSCSAIPASGVPLQPNQPGS